MHDRGASVSGRAYGDRPDRAAGRPGDLRGGEDSAGEGLSGAARGGGGGGAGRGPEEGAGGGGRRPEGGGTTFGWIVTPRGGRDGGPSGAAPRPAAATQ